MMTERERTQLISQSQAANLALANIANGIEYAEVAERRSNDPEDRETLRIAIDQARGAAQNLAELTRKLSLKLKQK